MICDACHEQINKWRDWREPYRGWRVVAYTPERNFQQSMGQYRARAEERRELIRSSIAGIRQLCREKHQESEA